MQKTQDARRATPLRVRGATRTQILNTFLDVTPREHGGPRHGILPHQHHRLSQFGPHHTTPRHATPRHATPRHATPRHTTPHHTTLLSGISPRTWQEGAPNQLLHTEPRKVALQARLRILPRFDKTLSSRRSIGVVRSFQSTPMIPSPFSCLPPPPHRQPLKPLPCSTSIPWLRSLFRKP